MPGNYLTVRPGARYFHSLRLLQQVKELGTRPSSPSPASWSGSGEERNEVLQLMDDLRAAEVDFMTIASISSPPASTTRWSAS